MWSCGYVLTAFIINAMEIFKQGWHNLIYAFLKHHSSYCLEKALFGGKNGVTDTGNRWR